MHVRLQHLGLGFSIISAMIMPAFVGCAPINPTVGPEWDGQIYRLLLGGTLSVRLPTDAEAANCNWRIAGLNQTFLRRIDNADTLSPGTRSQLASGDWVETFQFQGVIQGTTDLLLEYRCNETPTGETFQLTVQVVGSGI